MQGILHHDKKQSGIGPVTFVKTDKCHLGIKLGNKAPLTLVA